MKKINVIICTVMLIITTNVSSQNENKLLAINQLKIENNLKNDKFSELPKSTLDEISPRVKKEFKKLYENAEIMYWLPVGTSYIVKFINNNEEHRMCFDHSGNIEYDLKYYTEEKLDKEIRNTIKSNYYDFNIFWIDELTTFSPEKMITYIVKLEGKTTWKIILVCNGEMNQINEYDKNN